jgi:hypothetical protein
MSHLRKLCLAMVLAALWPSLLAAGALASHGQTTFFEAPALLLNPRTRPLTIATLKKLGVTALRVELSWHAVTPGAGRTHRPAFDATNPLSYDWALYDPLIEEAHRLGWKVLLTVTAPAPRWATSNPRGRSLVTRPDPRQFQAFMTAVGRHYGKDVALFSIWNEPNHHEFLEPQFNRDGSPASPRIYRALYQAGYAGLRAAGIANPTVLIGETAPEGESHPLRSTRATSTNMAPLTFLRGALCLDSHYRRARSCGPLAASGWGVHPYTSAYGPFYVPKDPETVTIGTLSRMTRALDLAAGAGALPAHLPVYITEFGVMSKPNRYQGVPLPQQAEYDAIDERIAYANPRVASFSQYLLRDDQQRSRKRVVFQTGLQFANGKGKPLLAGFPVPLTVTRRGHGYALWGHVRPAKGSTTAIVEARPWGSRRFSVLASVRTDPLGYWTLNSAVAASRWRVRWVSPEGVSYTGPPIRAY